MPRYSYYIPEDNVYKPWIPIRLNFKKTHKITPHNITALVDSGADVCFCSEDIAFWMGSRDSKSKEHKEFVTANGGKFIAYKEKITLIACDKSYNCPFFISKELPKQTPIILGQLGFFDHFKVIFDLPNKLINIT